MHGCWTQISPGFHLVSDGFARVTFLVLALDGPILMAQNFLFVAMLALASIYLASAQDGLPTMLKTLHTWPAWENNVASVSYPRSGYGYYNNNYYNNGMLA